MGSRPIHDGAGEYEPPRGDVNGPCFCKIFPLRVGRDRSGPVDFELIGHADQIVDHQKRPKDEDHFPH